MTFRGGPRRGGRFRFLLLVTLLARVGGLRSRIRLLVVALLEGEAYAHVDAATKERLLAEIPALAFPPRGMEL